MKRISLCILLALAAFHARAELSTASRDYVEKKYDDAFREFKSLAELGSAVAQYDLAVMYAHGEGTPASNTYAHAWASLAKAGGDEHAPHLVEALEPLLSPTSLQISAEIQAKYSQAALSARLMPKFLDNREFADRDPVRMDKPYAGARYPAGAEDSGIQGQVYVEYIVAADGHARLPHVAYAVPSDMFDASAREIILRTRYLPARIGGKPVASIAGQLINYEMKQFQKADYPGLSGLMARTLAKAQAGDAQAQTLYGMLLAGLPQVHKPFSEALPWFLKAAQSGSPYAEYQVGTALLHGRGCQCEETKGEIWLERAAQSDQPDAQVALAEYLLKDARSSEHMKSAQLWLERAAKSGNHYGKLYLAALLSTNPTPADRDPATALKLIDPVFRYLRDDPTTWEIRAAAQAANGNYAAAKKDETEALDMAKSLEWDTTPLEARLAAYAAGRPWTENLLVF
jgi:TonB family protein